MARRTTQLTTKFIAIAATALLLAACDQPRVKDFPPPERTQWKPVGVRMAGNPGSTNITRLNTFKTMHVDINNTDNLWSAVAPMFELDWVAETSMYIPEGPTLDQQGNIYFSPLQPREDVSLVSLDGATGARRWSIAGEGVNNNLGSGAPLILRDPANPEREIIYHATYARVMAITTAGEILWQTPTGLSAPMHAWGMNYHPQTDSVIGLTADGSVFVMDRKTGAARNLTLELPGAPTAPSEERPPQAIMELGDKTTEQVFGSLPDGSGFFTAIVDAVMGGGAKVSNYFGIDPNTSYIYIAGTAPDGEDGKLDGISEFGALYVLSLREVAGTYSLTIVNRKYLSGGSASTPTISPDSSRVMIADNDGNLIALDAALNELWRLDVGEQIAASIALSPDNKEIYAVGRRNIYKVIDHDSYGELAWIAELDAWSSQLEFNALTPTITANGIVVSVGAGYLPNQQLMLAVGMGVLDRETGKLRYFAEGREESISVSVVAPSGDIYTANSPVRRVIGHALLPNKTQPIIGGISKYRAIRLDLLARDASCAAQDRVHNLLSWYQDHRQAAADDRAQVITLIEQAQGALNRAVASADVSASQAAGLKAALSAAHSDVAAQRYRPALEQLSRVCAALP